MSATVEGGMIVSYRPAGNSTLRCAHDSRVARSSSIASVGTSTKSGVPTPAHALAPSRLALISTDPVGWVNRRRSPVEVATKVVSTTWRAYPKSVSRPANPRVSASAIPPKASMPVRGLGASQSVGAASAGSAGALSRAGGAAAAAAWEATTRSISTDGATALERTEPT